MYMFVMGRRIAVLPATGDKGQDGFPPPHVYAHHAETFCFRASKSTGFEHPNCALLRLSVVNKLDARQSGTLAMQVQTWISLIASGCVAFAGCREIEPGAPSDMVGQLAQCAVFHAEVPANSQIHEHIARLSPQADAGNLWAQFALCVEIAGKDEALRLLTDSAEMGESEAQYVLAGLILAGEFGEPDHIEAEILYRRAAAQEHVRAQLALGYMISYEVESAHWFRRAAENGSPEGQFSLGQMYVNGRGVLQDFARASGFFHQACEGGNARACYQLGEMYESGQGVLQDYSRAAELFRQTCESGSVGGCHRLGLLHRDGLGVDQDNLRAHALFNIDASYGHGTARTNRDTVARLMTPQQIAEAQALARQCSETSIAACLQ